MSKAIHPIFAAFALLLILSAVYSCTTQKNTAYFQTLPRDTVLRNLAAKNFDLKIKPDDVLAITIASASPELSTQYNSAQGAAASGAGYLVDKKGAIQLYKLGDVKVEGLSRDEAREKLQKELSPYLKEPVVTVRFVNHHITVLGAVGSPGVQPLATDQTSILDVIGQSGDLSETGKRENVLVIRQTDSGKVFKHLNLTDHSVFMSPYFYLQNEDVVYVEPELKKKESIGVAQVVSYIISGVSLITLLISRIN